VTRGTAIPAVRTPSRCYALRVTSTIVLVGLSGSGKSTVGRILAERLGWQFAGTDEEIARLHEAEVGDVFQQLGEARFREQEARLLDRMAAQPNTVVATGGGILTTARGRRAAARGLVVWLRITPEEAARRLAEDPATDRRPLLAGDPLTRLTTLLADRAHLYERADSVIDVDGCAPDEVAGRVEAAWRQHHLWARPLDRLEPLRGTAAEVRTLDAASSYPIIVRDDALSELGAVCREVGLRGRAFVLTDEVIAPLYRNQAHLSLTACGYATESLVIHAGEENKDLVSLAAIYDWLLERRAERSDFVVCLGGGVVTDMGGFAAATVLRGVPFIHVPTTLLGMVDASVGGKTGIDHPRGKNMIGAFAQPSVVVIDPTVLATLPERQVSAGWAELVKHGLILDAALFSDLEQALASGTATPTAAHIARSVAIKARIVSADERDHGLRNLLNYGHTLGHAIEAVTGYTTYLHGEAVAIGMHAAGLISVDMRLLSPAGLARQQAALRACGLPERAPGLDVDAVIEATLSDKKVREGAIHWVLLDSIGRAVVRNDVPPEVVQRAARAVLS
jgi:shikimate kinase/3-dehydroquinate synthase